mmetsp:Transcript_22176/g.48127  ORF Transcript_22176/g.48127 Transcript_22176/m.48127 type:complete len:203 (+) Transcript_22176:2627-3235(+)
MRRTMGASSLQRLAKYCRCVCCNSFPILPNAIGINPHPDILAVNHSFLANRPIIPTNSLLYSFSGNAFPTAIALSAAFSRTTFSSTARSNSKGPNKQLHVDVDVDPPPPTTYGISFPKLPAIATNTSSSSSTPSDKKGSNSSLVRSGPRAAAMVVSLCAADMREERSSERRSSMLRRASSPSMGTVGTSSFAYSMGSDVMLG